jgi:hypothetical protein
MEKKYEILSEFKIVSNGFNHGYSMTFENGYTISVQFSEMNYCCSSSDGKTTAEVAVIDSDGEWYQLVDGNDVIGWQSTNDVAKWMDKVSKLNKK